MALSSLRPPHPHPVSLAELNAAIRELLERINTRAFKKREGSRASFFQEVERAALSSSLKNELLGDAGMRRTKIKHASV